MAGAKTTQEQDIEAQAEQWGRQARRLLGDAHPLDDSLAQLADVMRRDPVKTGLIALGGGVLISLLLRR